MLKQAQTAWSQFTDDYATAQRGDLPAAQAVLTALSATRRDTKPDAEDLRQASCLAVLEDDLRGLVEIKQGKTDDGLHSIRQASDRYDAVAFDLGRRDRSSRPTSCCANNCWYKASLTRHALNSRRP